MARGKEDDNQKLIATAQQAATKPTVDQGELGEQEADPLIAIARDILTLPSFAESPFLERGEVSIGVAQELRGITTEVKHLLGSGDLVKGREAACTYLSENPDQLAFLVVHGQTLLAETGMTTDQTVSAFVGMMDQRLTAETVLRAQAMHGLPRPNIVGDHINLVPASWTLKTASPRISKMQAIRERLEPLSEKPNLTPPTVI